MTRRQQRMLLVYSIITSIAIMAFGILALAQVCEYMINDWNVSQFNSGWNWNSEGTRQAYNEALETLNNTEGWIYSILLKGRGYRYGIAVLSLICTFAPVTFWKILLEKRKETKTNR